MNALSLNIDGCVSSCPHILTISPSPGPRSLVSERWPDSSTQGAAGRVLLHVLHPPGTRLFLQFSTIWDLRVVDDRAVYCSFQKQTSYPFTNAKVPGWNNINFVYSRRNLAADLWHGAKRRLLRTMNLKTIIVEGVLITEQLRIVIDTAFRLSTMDALRGVLSKNDLFFNKFYTSLQVSRVQDLDIKRVVAFTDIKSVKQQEMKIPDQQKDEQVAYNVESLGMLFIFLILCLIVMAVFLLVICVLYCKARQQAEAEERVEI